MRCVELEQAIVSGPSEDETSQDAAAASPAPAVNRKIRRAKNNNHLLLLTLRRNPLQLMSLEPK